MHNNAKSSNAMCCTFLCEGERDDWYLDSGATEHMSCRREWFSNYKHLDVVHSVRIGNGDCIDAVGVGDIDVLVYDGAEWKQKFLSNALYVPKLVVNLFSQGRCLDRGKCEMKATSNECRFERDGKVFAVGKRESGLYRMMIRAAQREKEMIAEHIQTHANVASGAACDSIRLWHERLAHQGVSHVRQFLRRNDIQFVDDVDFQCEGCIYGKQHRLPFTSREEKSKFCGDVIHSDVCGPMAENSIGGSRYFLLFKDDYSHFRFVYFLRNKSEVA